MGARTSQEAPRTQTRTLPFTSQYTLSAQPILKIKWMELLELPRGSLKVPQECKEGGCSGMFMKRTELPTSTKFQKILKHSQIARKFDFDLIFPCNGKI
ncbi:hypothetical protein AVEN_44054-1 [Araneus ventricosus]|uniref:Uncharacterized protein n=1 Tax=Araneus ventricosus TaxID=182803 RepID=A0A4Y2H7I0_ARAVE|nr:hypothetical protein AVEN_44054-1 [Araneus ventricosus]